MKYFAGISNFKVLIGKLNYIVFGVNNKKKNKIEGIRKERNSAKGS